MERLTFSREFEGKEGIRRDDVNYVKPELAIKIYKCLAQYEDIGLTPEEIQDLMQKLTAENAQLRKERDAAENDLEELVREDVEPCDICKKNNTIDCHHPASCPERKYHEWEHRGPQEGEDDEND